MRSSPARESCCVPPGRSTCCSCASRSMRSSATATSSSSTSYATSHHGSSPRAAARSRWSSSRPAPRTASAPATDCRSLRSTSEHATAARPARARVSRRDRARRPRQDRRRRPLPGDRRVAFAERAVARRAAPARVRGAVDAARRRDDPRTANQDEGDGVSYSEKIKEVIEGSDVAIFMKGTPAFAMCGNSDRALQALRRAGASVTAVDVLPDPAIRQELTAISGWPTIPQVFVKGELVGGADIVEELEASGQLEETLREKLGDDYASARDENTVALA